MSREVIMERDKKSCMDILGARTANRHRAAIGGIPLALGFACGDVVLTVAVLAIVLTAPLGAFAIDSSYKKISDKN